MPIFVRGVNKQRFVKLKVLLLPESVNILRYSFEEEKTFFGMNFLTCKVPKIENMHFHFGAFSGWGHSHEKNYVKSLFLIQLYA